MNEFKAQRLPLDVVKAHLISHLSEKDIAKGGLYKASKDSTHALVHHSIDPGELWHRRFGHLHYTTLLGLQKMVTGMPEVSSKHEGICKGCALGKNTKKSFPRSKSRSKGILDLIHSDICGHVFTLLE